MNRLFKPLLLLLFSFALLAPAHAGKRPPDVVEDALAFATTDRSKAIQLLEDALADGPPAKDVDVITVYAGEQRRLAGDGDQAHTHFSGVLGRTDKGAEADAARMGLTLLQAGEALKPKTVKLLEDVSEKNALATQNADRFYLLAVHAKGSGDEAGFKANAKKARTYAKEDPAVLDRIKAGLTAVRTGEEAPPPPAAGDSKKEGKLARADAALTEGKKDEARRLANDVKNNVSDPLKVRAAEYLLRRIDGAPVSSRKVVVLLPLEGKYAAVGKQVQGAIQFGHREGGAPFSLEFVDSGATPESAVAALEKAVIDMGAVAVMGPLLSDETDAVVEAAEALRVPLISLSQSLEDVSEKEFVLQAMMSAGDQIRALLDEVMGKEGMDSFVAFAPQSAYGERAVEAFKAEVAARNGKVPAVEFYDPASTDLIEFAKKLGRKDYKARAAEYYDLKKAAEEKGGDPSKVVLPPVMDFDAIFLPDNAARVPLACAALAYEEFPMGDFLPTKDSPTIPVLGLSGWNKHQLVGTGGPYARRGYFTDAFLQEAPIEEPPWKMGEAQGTFVRAYKAETRRTPSALEAQMVDAGKLLAAAGKANPANRAEMLKALLEATPADPVSGLKGLNAETHRADRDLWILSLSEEAIVPRGELPPPVER